MRIHKVKYLLLIFVMILTATACSSNKGKNSEAAKTDNSGSGENAVKHVKLEFWNSAYPTVDSNNKTKKKEDFYLYQAIKRYEAANPGIAIKVQDVPGGDPLFTKFQTASLAQNGPDLTVMWSGSYLLRFKQFLEPMDGYFTKEEMDRISGWDAVTEGYKAGGGTTYGVPFSTDGTSVLGYNKKIFQDAGIDLANKSPKNFNEFLSMLQQIKANTGLSALGLKFDENFWHIPSYWIAQTMTSAGLGDIVNGKQNFSDPRILEIFNAWNQLYQSGSVYTDTADTAIQMFLQGQIAMVTVGNSTIAPAKKALGDNFGMLKVPNFKEDVAIPDGGVGGVGSAFLVPNYSKNKQEAVKFIKFLMSKDEQIKQIEAGETSLTIAKDVNINEYIKDPLVQEMQKWANEPSTIFWPDNLYPAELTTEIAKLQGVLFNGKMTAEEFAKQVDQKRDELLKASK